MLIGRINRLDMLIGELCPPTSKYLEGDHVYKDASLHLHESRVRPETAQISCSQSERLTFDGSQYVMTAYHPTSEDTIEIELKRTEGRERAYIFGCRSSGVTVQDCFYLASTGNSSYPALGDDESMINEQVYTASAHVLTMNSSGYYVDGLERKSFSAGSFASSLTLCIGGLNEDGYIDGRLFTGEIYNVRVWRGENVLHEYIPASEGGEQGLYDMQTGRFFRRCSVSGSTVSVSGIPPIEIYPQGTALSDCIIYGSSRGVGDYDSTCSKYMIPVTVRSRNLFDPDNADILALYPDQDGTVTVSGTTNATRQRSFCMRVEPGTQYTVSVEYTGRVTARVAGYSSYPQAGDSCEFVDRELVSLSPMVNSFVTTADTRYILCYFSYGRNTDELGDVLETIQLEKGGQATEYVPYIISRTELYLDQPLTEGEYVSVSELGREIEVSTGYSSVSISTLIQPDRITVKYLV